MKNIKTIIFVHIAICLSLFAVVENDTSSVTYSATDGVLSYNIPFDFFENTDILASFIENNIESPLSYGSDFTIDDSDLLLSSELYTTGITGKLLYIYRVIQKTQERDFIEGGRFKAEEVEAALDKLTMLTQQVDIANDLSEELKFPVGEVVSNPYLPVLLNRANKFLKFDDNGLPTANISAELFSYVGSWQASTDYTEGEVFYDPANPTIFYYVIEDYTSGVSISSSSIELFFNVEDVYTELVQTMYALTGWQFISGDLVPMEEGLAVSNPNGYIKHNYSATVDPTENDDIDNYAVGSDWINTITGGVFKCIDSTDGAAVWAQTNGSGTYTGGSGVEVGSYAFFPTENVPTGYLVCDGSAYLKTTYPDLYEFLKDGGSTCIYGEDTTTFNVPPASGYFLRVFDNGAGLDPDAATRLDRGDGTTGDEVGTVQASIYSTHSHGSPITTSNSANHNHTGTTDTDGSHDHTAPIWLTYYGNLGSGAAIAGYLVETNSGLADGQFLQPIDITHAGVHSHSFTTGNAGTHSHSVTLTANGGGETRPKNIYVQACIKY